MAVSFPAKTDLAGGTRARSLATAIVLNWNRANLTCRAIESLRAQAGFELDAIVVDNGSTGDDVAEIRSQTGARVIALDENVGFARAVNAGAIAAMRDGCRYLLLFNNDAHLEPGTSVVRSLVDALESDPSLGAAGAIIGNDDDAMSVQSVSYRLSPWFPIPIARKSVPGPATRLGPNEYLSGSCLLVRATAFARVRGFDPDFFFYGDDVDIARRLQAAGFGLRLIAARGVRHERGASIGVGSPAYAYAAVRSHLILIGKHARWYQRPSAYATMIAASLFLALRGMRHGNVAVVRRVLEAWRDFATHRWGGFGGSTLAPAVRPSPDDLE